MYKLSNCEANYMKVILNEDEDAKNINGGINYCFA